MCETLKLNFIKNKIKNNRSLQIKIVLVIGIVLSYYFLFGDIGNWNVKIESITQKSDQPFRDYIYSVSLENDKLKINKFTKSEIEKTYCRDIDNHHKIRRVLSFNPIIVECEPNMYVYGVIIVNGETSRKVGYKSLTNHLIYSWEGTKREYKYKDTVIKLPTNSNLTIDAIEQKYCKEFDLKLRKIIEVEPMEVACGLPDFARSKYITNGNWMHLADKLDDIVVGQNEKYLLREDYSLIDKITGKITENNITSSTSGRRLHINGTATLSKNMRYFVRGHTKSMDPTIDEINEVGEKTILYTFNNYIFFKDAHISALTSSHDGNYVFMLVSKSHRMPGGDLLFYIIDVRNRSILYRKILERNTQGLRNYYISNQSGNILFKYQAYGLVYAYKVVLKNKLRAKT